MQRIRVAWLCGWLLACAVGVAAAKTAEEVHKAAEAGMVVTGTVEVNPSGSLHGYALDHPEKLPPVVVEIIGKTLATWRFQLSGPTADAVATRMSLRVIAKPTGDGGLKVTVQGASFGDPGSRINGIAHKEQPVVPRYPPSAIRERVSGTVYLALRVGRDGVVQEAVAEQVNLDQYDREATMERHRKVLADASLEAARKWTFDPPTQGPDADNPYWVVRVPVDFDLRPLGTQTDKHAYGQWDVYIPGPRQTPPWIGKALANEAPDAAFGDEPRTGDARLTLITPLGGA